MDRISGCESQQNLSISEAEGYKVKQKQSWSNRRVPMKTGNYSNLSGQQFDRLKDRHCVPLRQRRATHINSGLPEA